MIFVVIIIICYSRMFFFLVMVFVIVHTTSSDFMAEVRPVLTTGTTIVGLCCSDAVVLGADTRSTGGPLVMDKNKLKIHFIAKHIYCCAAGTSADCDQLTRKACKYLGELRTEKQLWGQGGGQFMDSVLSAVHSFSLLLDDKLPRGRIPQASLILGGVDESGPSLFQMDDLACPQQVMFAALGSGSTSALAVLESANAGMKWSVGSKSLFQSNLHVEEAVDLVRKAVQAGILNDLGSGSHVDLCVIQQGQVKRWRENMVSSWEQEHALVDDMNGDVIEQNSLEKMSREVHARDASSVIADIDVDLI